MAGNDNPPVGNWHYEWREISNPYADFNQTKLYELIANLFSQKGHKPSLFIDKGLKYFFK